MDAEYYHRVCPKCGSLDCMEPDCGKTRVTAADRRAAELITESWYLALSAVYPAALCERELRPRITQATACYIAEAMQPERDTARKLAEDYKQQIDDVMNELCFVMNQGCPEHIQLALGPLVAYLKNASQRNLAAWKESQK